ncbi:hypothetical protein VHP8226_03743 [Vibrio hippocampi]|uniref:Uncharacterized protein n=1 Tax=Vibrio hippocampi TaxID=654686 RepID=A0ABN8DP86_9VIBR|nr:hypothetical protein VHP8226_03743 [Vibrio hippocampi]
MPKLKVPVPTAVHQQYNANNEQEMTLPTTSPLRRKGSTQGWRLLVVDSFLRRNDGVVEE